MPPRRRPGKSRQAGFTSAATDRPGATTATTRTRRCAPGPATFAVGEATAARCGASSTTTSRARRRTTRKGCSTFSASLKRASARLCRERLRQGEVVAVDHLGAAGVAEDILDLAARPADDPLGLVGVVGDEAAPELAGAVADDHRVAAREGAFDA